MRRTGVLLVAIALGFAGLTGCSGGDDKYCGLLKDMENDKTSGAALAGDDPKAIEKVVNQVKEVEAAAPGDVQEEWKAMTAGMDMGLQMTKDPAKVDMKAAEKTMEEMESAMKTVATDAKDRCGITLDLEG